MSVHHCFSTEYLIANISKIIKQFTLYMFIFNFQNLGLVTLNLIKNKTVDIIVLLIYLPPLSRYCQQLPSFDWSSSQLCCWRNLWTFPKLFDGIAFAWLSCATLFIKSTNIWQTSNLKNIMSIITIPF